MRNLLLLSLLLTCVSPKQNPAAPQDAAPVVVLGSKWFKSRQIVENQVTEPSVPAREMIPQNKNYQRNARINDPVGARDPNEDTIDGRSAAIEKNVQESRRAPKPVDGFSYRAKIQNASTRVVEIVFWEYQFIDPANPGFMARRQFLCGVKINPAKERELQAFSLSGPSDVISVQSSGNKSESAFQEKVVINRVEYADGTIWQRKDWNFAEIRLGYKRAVGTPWGSEMCRGL
ncbi:MAG TPA: hypothetical protein VN920_15495 [Pyrinomonadaceae bacterium]|nr:hypothetical protein [Pyrinomonadaceae bacterium]